MNGFINTKTNTERLQFGQEKCHKMRIWRKNSYCPDLYIDQVIKMEDSDEEKYLRDILTSVGINNIYI